MRGGGRRGGKRRGGGRRGREKERKGKGEKGKRREGGRIGGKREVEITCINIVCTGRSAAKRRKLDDSSETHLNFQSGEGLV